MTRYLCFGCHDTFGEDDTPSTFPAGCAMAGLCEECQKVGQVAAIARRPKPCPCQHCSYWRDHTARICEGP